MSTDLEDRVAALEKAVGSQGINVADFAAPTPPPTEPKPKTTKAKEE